jgi:hypothetical protein
MTAIPWVSPLQVAPEGEGDHYSGDAERIPDPRSQARRGRIEAASRTPGRRRGGGTSKPLQVAPEGEGGHYSGDADAERIPDSRSQARRGRIEAWAQGALRACAQGAHRGAGASKRGRRGRCEPGRRGRIEAWAQGRERGRGKNPRRRGEERTGGAHGFPGLQVGHLSEKTPCPVPRALPPRNRGDARPPAVSLPNVTRTPGIVVVRGKGGSL